MSCRSSPRDLSANGNGDVPAGCENPRCRKLCPRTVNALLPSGKLPTTRVRRWTIRSKVSKNSRGKSRCWSLEVDLKCEIDRLAPRQLNLHRNQHLYGNQRQISGSSGTAKHFSCTPSSLPIWRNEGNLPRKIGDFAPNLAIFRMSGMAEGMDSKSTLRKQRTFSEDQ